MVFPFIYIELLKTKSDYKYFSKSSILLKMKKINKIILLPLLLLVSVISCQKDDFGEKSKYAFLSSSDSLREWFKLECRIIKETDGFFPPQAARAFGYTGITVYEAVSGGMRSAPSLAGQLDGLTASMLPQREDNVAYDWSLASNAAAAEIMRKLFEKKISTINLSNINNLENTQYEKLRIGVVANTVIRSVQYGKDVATAMFNYSKTDGGHDSYLDPFQLPYTAPIGVDKWVQTSAKFATPLSPNWQQCRYMLKSNEIFATPPKPVTFSATDTTSEFYRQAIQVYKQVKNNTSEQVEIAKYWADDPFSTCTPSGHTFNILTQILEETEATLEKAAVAYGLMGIAENDAFIACWKTKYDYSLIRPVTYIQKYIDPNFTTVIGTPPFPAYTSGHATEGAVGSRIMTRLFTNGDGNYPFTDRTQIQFGFSVRNYRNFEDLANECANSRLYGGIHYDMDNQKGLQMGRGIGDNVLVSIKWPKLAK